MRNKLLEIALAALIFAAFGAILDRRINRLEERLDRNRQRLNGRIDRLINTLTLLQEK